MIEVGRLCMKIAGRDAGSQCVVVDILDSNHVLIDGQARRRKCNIRHLEPIEKTIKIKKGASHSDVVKEFKKLGIEARETKPKKAKPRPRKQRGKKKKAAEEDVKTGKKTEAEKTEKKDIKKEPEKKEIKEQEDNKAEKKTGAKKTEKKESGKK